jgi:hypothetical protein
LAAISFDAPAIFHVARPVRDNAVATTLGQRCLLERLRLQAMGTGARHLIRLAKHAVDHHVANVVDGGIRPTFVFEMHDAAHFGDKEAIGHPIRHQSVDHFRHRNVAAAQSGPRTRHQNAQHLGDDRAGQRRIHIANQRNRMWPVRLAVLLEGNGDLAHPLRVRTATGSYENIRLGNAQFIEQHVVHLLVAMLAGVDDLVRRTAVHLRASALGMHTPTYCL